MHITSQLRHTKATHTDDLQKSYECAECGRTFKQSRDLARHSRVHTGEKPYKCQLCGRDFGRADTLKVHLRTHKNEPQFSEGLRSFTMLNPPPPHATNPRDDSITTDINITMGNTATPKTTTPPDVMDNNTASTVDSTALTTVDTTALSTIDMTVLSTHTAVSVESSHVLVTTTTTTPTTPATSDINSNNSMLTKQANDNREQNSVPDDLASPLFFATYQTSTATTIESTTNTEKATNNMTTRRLSSLTEDDDSTITPRYYVAADHESTHRELGILKTLETTTMDNNVDKSTDEEANSESMTITPRDYNETHQGGTNNLESDIGTNTLGTVIMREERIAQPPPTQTENEPAKTATLLENVVVEYLPLIEDDQGQSLVAKDEGTTFITPAMEERPPVNTISSTTADEEEEEEEVNIGMTVTLRDDGNGMLVMVASSENTAVNDDSTEQNLEFSSSEK